MRCTEIVAEATYQPNMIEQRPLFSPKAIDRDAALVAQLRRGTAEAVEALIRVYGDRVHRLAIRITGNAADADEVVQDTMWTVSRKIDTFRGASALGSWIYRITANAAYQKLRGGRSKRNEVSWDDLAPAFDEKGQHVEAAVDWSARLEDPAIADELKSVLWGAIDELPDHFRRVFLLHDVEGLSNPEIAETLDVDLDTVKSRVHRARLLLRKRLAGYMAAPAPLLRQ